MDRAGKLATVPSADPDYGLKLLDFGRALSLAAAEGQGPLPSTELTTSLVVAGSGALDVSTDDSATIAKMVDQINEQPHLFAERYLRLERAVRETDDRVDALNRWVSDLSYRVPV